MVGPPNDGVKAWTHAKSGIARSGAARAGFYLYNVQVLMVGIDAAGVRHQYDFAQWILQGSLRITHGANDERDTCSFTLNPLGPARPEAGQYVQVLLGGASVPEFAGRVVIVQHRRRARNDTPWYDVQCVDLFYSFDARLVTWDWAPDSASTIAIDLVTRFCAGFTTRNVPAGLPSVPRVTVVNQRPSTILRSLAATIGGGFRLDATSDLHLWTGTYETGPGAGTDPMPLTDTLPTLKAFSRTYDASNLRTRVIVEGQRTDLLLGMPAGADGSQFGRILTVPVTDSSYFGPLEPPANTDPFRLLRIGPQVLCMDTRASYIPAFDPEANTKGSRLTANTNVEPDINGLNVFHLEAVAWAAPYVPGWFRVADQIVFIEQINTTDLILFTRRPNWPWGSLQTPVSTGASMTAVASLVHVLTWEEKPEWARVKQPVLAQELGAPVVARVHLEDAAAREAWAAIEASDGIHEALIQDGRLSDHGAKERAALDLAEFARPVLTINWETDDLNARPGRKQIVNLGPPDPLAVDMQITRSEVTFLVANHPPRRVCEASKVKVAGLLDFILTDNTAANNRGA